jgi:hypothetical protein
MARTHELLVGQTLANLIRVKDIKKCIFHNEKSAREEVALDVEPSVEQCIELQVALQTAPSSVLLTGRVASARRDPQASCWRSVAGPFADPMTAA